MNKKQNSLMRFSRTERLAQLSEQEIVIERKKREILAKIEAQKKKETEEALKKVESSKDSRNNKFGFSKKPWRGIELKKNKNTETTDEPIKESLTNAFSNDGSFLDQFKKLSKSGLSSDNVDMKTLALTRQNDEFKECQGTDEKYFKNKLNENKKDNSHRNIEKKNTDGNFTSKSDTNHSVFDKQLLNSDVQLLPQAFVKSHSQQQNVSIIPAANNLMSLSPSHSDQTTLNQVSANDKNTLQLNSSHINYSGILKPLPALPLQGKKSYQVFESKKENKSLTPELGHDLESSTPSLSNIQPPLPITPQNIPPPLPIQVQNIPPPPIPPKDNELPKFRTEGISLSLKANTTKKLEIIPNPLEFDEPPSPKTSSVSFSDGNKISPQNFTSASISENVSSEIESQVSSAFYNDNEDEDIDHLNEEWAQLVARCGDDYEDSLADHHQNDPSLRFLFDKNSKEYLSYRKLVLKYRRNQSFSEYESSRKIQRKSCEEESKKKMLSTNSDKRLLSTRNNDNDRNDLRDNSMGEKLDLHESREAKKYCDQSYKESHCKKISELIPSYSCQNSSLKGTSDNSKETEIEISDQAKTDESRKRKRKSRWGDLVASTSTAAGTGNVNIQLAGKLPQSKSTLLSQLTRSDPGLIQYAKQTFGSTNLSEEDWKKAEDHYKINLLYQDMVKKRAEVEKLERQGKFKYEYDSDEDTEGGTWEHKLRQQEMQATQLWAEELTRQAAGKHHIGDFLPPEELERFMEKYNAVKEGREPDLSDYKEYKLKEDNVGYRLLQKMGWNEGQGLGQDGSGIQNPVNKATTRHENQGLGVERPDGLEAGDDEYDAYRKRMMLAYRFRPNPLNNPRRPYY